MDWRNCGPFRIAVPLLHDLELVKVNTSYLFSFLYTLSPSSPPLHPLVFVFAFSGSFRASRPLFIKQSLTHFPPRNDTGLNIIGIFQPPTGHGMVCSMAHAHDPCAGISNSLSRERIGMLGRFDRPGRDGGNKAPIDPDIP